MPDIKRNTVAFVSSNYWSIYLAELALLYGPKDVKIIAINTNNILSIKSIRLLLQSTHIVRVGLPPLLPHYKNLALDIILFFLGLPSLSGQKQFCYWIGSDVLYYSKPVGKILGLLRSVCVDRLKHISGSPWLTSELAASGIISKTVIFPYRIKQTSPRWNNSKFHISWYLPANNPIAYGQKHLDAIADAFPNVVIHAYGCTNYWRTGTTPQNICVHGWIDDSVALISQCQIHSRIIEHDSLGGSVRDALASASHVLYTYSLPYCSLAIFNDIDHSLQLVKSFYERFQLGDLTPNFEGQAWALANLTTEKLTIQLGTVLLH